jgi:hypothetical protein
MGRQALSGSAHNNRDCIVAEQVLKEFSSEISYAMSRLVGKFALCGH